MGDYGPLIIYASIQSRRSINAYNVSRKFDILHGRGTHP